MYSFVDEQQVALDIKDLVQKVSDTLSLDFNEAMTLIRAYKWDTIRAQDYYLSKFDEVRKELGFEKESAVKREKGVHMCYVCCDDFDENNFFALCCGHEYCFNCWKTQLKTLVEKGMSCINGKCFEMKCPQRIPDEVFHKFLDEKLWDRYERLMIKSFVNDNPDYNWCVGTDCPLICRFPSGGSSNVTCPKCWTTFCFKCLEEPHRPATCEMVKNWNQKSIDDGENVKWLTANTKQCPKCHTNIEKNQGCNHMTCNKSVGGCGHEFCWLCMGAWNEHGSKTGGYYECTIFKEMEKKGVLSKEEQKKENCKNELQLYQYYFDLFMNNKKSKDFGVSLKPNIEKHIELLINRGHSRDEVSFLRDAVDQVIENRQILTWSYVYGYYLQMKDAQNKLFDEHRSILNGLTEVLQEQLEKKLDPFISYNRPYEEFRQFRSDMMGYTTRTKQFVKNLLESIDSSIL